MTRSDAIQGWRRWTLVALLALVSLNAIAAGYGFVREPSGAALGIPQEWLESSPFDDYQIPGAILVALGILYAFAAAQEVRRARSAWFWAGLSGGAMIVWIIVQVAMMGYDRHPIQTALQAIVMTAGIAIGITPWVSCVWRGRKAGPHDACAFPRGSFNARPSST